MPAFRMRSSKFRHVFGKPFRKELCYENIRMTRNAHDGTFCAVNPHHLAVVTESAGGGSFIILPVSQGGRVDVNLPKVSGHAGAILDLKWNPFDPNVIASGSDDSTVKVWQIPGGEGLASNLTEWQVDLHGHQRRVTYLDWHPTAANILLSAGMDFKCYIWNIEQAEPVNEIGCHRETIFSISWNREGSLFATTCKDKKIRVIDPRTANVAAQGDGHLGNKTSKCVFLEDSRIFTTGFSRNCDREIAIWDIRNMSRSQKLDSIDCSSGVIQPYYDPDIRVIFLAGKGDGNIRYYEISDDSQFFYYLDQYMSSSPQRGVGRMPKLGCDSSKCEIQRFYKIHGSKSLLEPISMIVPRKSELFQEDIFPPTAGMIPSLTADEWVSGQNREPILVSLQDGSVTNTPKVSTSRPVLRQDGALQSNPVITTYTAVSRPNRNQPMKRANTIAASTVPNNIPPQEPASLKNIKRLSVNEDFVSFDSSSQGLNQKRAMFEETSSQNNNNNIVHNNKNAAQTTTENHSSNYERRVWSPKPPLAPSTSPSNTNGLAGSDSEQEYSPFPRSPMSGFELAPLTITPLRTNDNVESDVMEWRSNAAYQRRKRPLSSSSSLTANSPPPVQQPNPQFNSLAKLVIGEPSQQSQTNKIHVRKVWHAHSPSTAASATDYNGHNLHNDIELKKAYFRQQEEIRCLQEQLKVKDRRIQQLEGEVAKLRGEGEESNC